ncbi:MAG: dTDP-4-dehydrorhamnose 3,5-epimerase [bacterium TMED264]|nr:MAG: dTDP-4-dehydrorhamnose 3,5-epimerase [bacterium TMED264]
MPIISKKCFTKDNLEIEGPLIIEPQIFEDQRGFFFESWNKRNWEEILKIDNQSSQNFVQDNHSKSSKGTLRGLHYQIIPSAQGKLVRCTKGEIFDVAIDLRKSSSTFCKYIGVRLNNKNQEQLWIPKGFAHGFLTLSDYAEVNYKTTDYWDSKNEKTIIWDEKMFNIDWPLEEINFNIHLSIKDQNGLKFSQLSDNDLFL